MIMREREGLIARIRQIRRVAARAEKRSAAATASQDASEIRALETRVAHLEQLVEGLQDSVYRESERNRKMVAELQAKIRPATLRAALSKDARERGL
jgi:uncharacterized coiled-coil protein SlyX